jgi:hypothetical protein
VNRHQEAADRYRALAAQARSQGQASALGNVGQAHDRAAARWEALAELEEMYLVQSQTRLAQAPTLTGARAPALA